MNTKARKARETDAENRERALKSLEKAKTKEMKLGLTPLHLYDENKTILMISPKLSQRQRQKLKEKRLQQLSKKHVIIESK